MVFERMVFEPTVLERMVLERTVFERTVLERTVLERTVRNCNEFDVRYAHASRNSDVGFGAMAHFVRPAIPSIQSGARALRIPALVGGVLFVTLSCGWRATVLASSPTAEATAEGDSATAAGLVITEVAQGVDYGNTHGDKVEVVCARASGCRAFRVCDASSGKGQSCSSLQSPSTYGQRFVLSRGTSITQADELWIVDEEGAELAGSRVGPFPCADGSASSRRDCSMDVFRPCGVPNLGQSVGDCSPEDFPEPFRYRVQFTSNQQGAPEATCLRPMCRALLEQIESARSHIDFAIYGVRGQPAIIEALARAQARGVEVRGVIDAEDATCTKYGYADSPMLVNALLPGSVHCDSGVGASYIMHNKFFVFDWKTLWTGSTNVSDTELGGEYSADVAAFFDSYRLASIYEDEFDEMYSGRFHKRKVDDTEHVIEPAHFMDQAQVMSYFSPTDQAVKHAVLPAIEGATQRIDIAMFYLTHPEIADALVAARGRNVQIRLILDASGASSAWSQHERLCAAGVDVKVENWGGKSHSKWLVSDIGVPGAATVVFGSMNFTRAGDEQNDENTLYVRHQGFACAFQAEFERQWSALSYVPLCTRMPVEGAASSNCASGDCHLGCSSGSCCDGLDNDYDGLVDQAEESCGCADGLDNDGDGYVDDEDFDCGPVVEDP
ncbi:MAG: phospholipase D-like domain-containing protein [Polyangiaceae bacterium]